MIQIIFNHTFFKQICFSKLEKDADLFVQKSSEKSYASLS